jgi:hypothetical protein
LRQLGFEGPYTGTRHQFVVFGARRLAIPSYEEISVAKLREVVAEVESLVGRRITADEWSGL